MESTDQILVVDDDAEIRGLLCDYLRKNGYGATAVADGRAMWAARAHGGELVLRNGAVRGLEAILTLPRTGA